MILQHPSAKVIMDDPPVTPTSVRQAIEASNTARQEINAAVGEDVIPLHSVPDALNRMDDYTKAERCGADLIADAIARHLFGRSYDELPKDARARVEGAARHAIRAALLTWNQEAARRATAALDKAMAQELGMPYAAQPLARRLVLAQIGARVVQAALVGTLDLEHPFTGPGEALKVYDAAEAEAKQVMAAASRKGARS